MGSPTPESQQYVQIYSWKYHVWYHQNYLTMLSYARVTEMESYDWEEVLETFN